MATATITIAQTQTPTCTIPSLLLRPLEAKKPEDEEKPDQAQSVQKTGAPQAEAPYRYARLLPVFSADRYPPLEPFEHVDPGHRALAHPNPRSFLDGVTNVHDLTPNLGSEIRGVNLAMLTPDERDQVALEVRVLCHRSALVWLL